MKPIHKGIKVKLLTDLVYNANDPYVAVIYAHPSDESHRITAQGQSTQDGKVYFEFPSTSTTTPTVVVGTDVLQLGPCMLDIYPTDKSKMSHWDYFTDVIPNSVSM